jgi:hypothetical protein
VWSTIRSGPILALATYRPKSGINNTNNSHSNWYTGWGWLNSGSSRYFFQSDDTHCCCSQLAKCRFSTHDVFTA